MTKAKSVAVEHLKGWLAVANWRAWHLCIRDLALIHEELLQTKSRAVLLDTISMNGL